MTAPFPPEAAPGGTVYKTKADQVYRHFTNIARLSAEILADTDVNMVKVAQLALVDGYLFNILAQDASDEFLAAIESRLAQAGLVWATTITDLDAIRVECNAFKVWIGSNFATEVLEPAVVTYSSSSDTVTQVPNTIAKPSTITAEVQKIRDLYGAA